MYYLIYSFRYLSGEHFILQQNTILFFMSRHETSVNCTYPLVDLSDVTKVSHYPSSHLSSKLIISTATGGFSLSLSCDDQLSTITNI